MKQYNQHEKVRQLVAQIPKGKVATYGAIAKQLGITDARIVGWAIHRNEDSQKVPCHRVVMADGSVSEGYSLGGWREQKSMLIQEGVKFIDEKKVDLSKHLWDK